MNQVLLYYYYIFGNIYLDNEKDKYYIDENCYYRYCYYMFINIWLDNVKDKLFYL